MFLRASGLARGATASSMSRKTWSAPRPLALSIILVLEPGTARFDRRERSGRAGMAGSENTDVMVGGYSAVCRLVTAEGPVTFPTSWSTEDRDASDPS